MVIYIIAYTTIMVASTIKKIVHTKKIVYLLLTLLGLFLCFGYMTGSDWRQYEKIYELINLSNLATFTQGIEYSYSIIQIISKSIGLSFWHFLILLKVTCFFIIINLFIKYSIANFLLGILLFFGIFALDIFIDDPVRNMVSATIVLISYKYIIKNNFLKYSLLIMFACSFHMSAMIIFPIYFIRNLNLSNKLILISLLTLILFTIVGHAFFRDIIINYVWNTENILSSRFNSVYLDESLYIERKSPITMGFIIHYLAYILVYYKKKEVYSIKYGKLLFNLSYIYIIVYTLSFFVFMFFRIRLFLFLPFCIMLSYLPFLYKNIISKLIAISIVIIISFFTMISTITKSYKFIPYTNHLSFLFKDKPSYLERVNHNFKYSPYAK